MQKHTRSTRGEDFVIEQENQERIQNEIAALEAAVTSFDYTELRAVSSESASESDKTYWASETAMAKLFEMFSDTFIFSQDEHIKACFKNLADWPPIEMKLVTQLANTLLTFKKNIEEAELAFFARKYPDEPERVKMSAEQRSGHEWLSVFQYMIERHLDTDKFSGKYKPFIENLQHLPEKACLYIAKHAKEQLTAYDKLMNPEDIKKQLSATTHRKQGVTAGRRGGLFSTSTQEHQPTTSPPTKSSKKRLFEAAPSETKEPEASAEKKENPLEKSPTHMPPKPSDSSSG